ncbi:MAG: GC-type dockerin domain-anchored protein, partial [Phycisphaerales bacterium JB058]
RSPSNDPGYVFRSNETHEEFIGQTPTAHNHPGNPNIRYGQGGYHDIGAVKFQSTSCFADTNYDGFLTPADFSAWVAAYNQGDFVADQNRDGVLTPSDFSAWVANYNTGCP